ncbi:MAG: helix-turn-helix domain-containing protein [Verrucomicrobia bacterium]|nr:helix-turn-helix domain-containing protein [Verrucomicrobiota bacterium]
MKPSIPKPIYRRKLGDAIRHRRKARKLSQEKLAEHADVHRNYIGLIERGEQNITIGSLVKVAKALKCKVMDLVVDAGI